MHPMNYLKYMKNGEIFYRSKMLTPHDNNEYFVENLPENYNVIYDKENYWKYYSVEDETLCTQGWKIHVSSNSKDTLETLKYVSQVAINYNIPFKHLLNEQIFFLNNSKNANRASSGKFIVLYPKNKNQFLLIMEEIRKKIRNLPKGPYILSDKRWKDSNVYYRYGGFVAILNDKGEHCIKDQNGNLIPDDRTPFYTVPDFEKSFDEYLDELNKSYRESTSIENPLNNYEILGALSFSNSGGVYKAQNKENQKKVIIKEARYNTGFDGQNRTALERQKIEYEALSDLSSVNGIVNAIDYFKVWEHQFMVEEFIEGDNLHSWLAKNYPFLKDEDTTIYTTNIESILKKLEDIITLMHKNNIVMGDLQPYNIIVDEKLNVTLIDFETASYANEKPSVGLGVPSFSNYSISINTDRDWYALYKIARFCLLPTYTSAETEYYLNTTHKNWIKKYYGASMLGIIEHIEGKLKKPIKEYNYLKENDYTTNDLICKIKSGIFSNTYINDYLWPNDVRQSEYQNGDLTILYGSLGVIWSLLQSGENLNSTIKDWIEANILEKSFHNNNTGLFTGTAGIATVLYQAGYKDRAINMFDAINLNLNTEDISIVSGQSGIGLTLLSLYNNTNDEKILNKCKYIASTIINNYKNDIQNKIFDPNVPNIGLLNGWSGASLFFCLMYKYTKDEKFSKYANEFLKIDIKLLKEEKNTMQLFDENNPRLLPYLSHGSIGVGIAIKYLKKVTNNPNIYSKELELITNLHLTKTTIDSGLLYGAAGFLLIPTIMENTSSNKIDEASKNVHELLKVFLAQKDNYILTPGELSNRFTFDISSGSSGVLLGLLSYSQNNCLLWLPCINNKSFFSIQE